MPAGDDTADDGDKHQSGHPAIGEEQLLFIDGRYVPSSDGATFAVTNPMTGAKLYDCASATVADYTRAIEAAHAAFSDGPWPRMGPSARRLVLLRAADILETYLDQAGELMSSEVSATKGWVRLNVLSTVNLLREVAGLATHIKGEIVPADRPGTTILVERQAVGVNLAIAPWNAPVRIVI
jgi:benzaldehyde dehydrogenase (NAD)